MLETSVVSWRRAGGVIGHCAVRGGVLTVQAGERIAIATRDAVLGDDLVQLEAEVLATFRAKAAEEQSARADSARLQLAAVRRMFDYLRPERAHGHAPAAEGRRAAAAALMAKEPGHDGNSLAEPVRRRRARTERWQREGERPLAHNLAMIGVLGWLIVTPTLVGIFLGRWLDHAAASGIFWTLSLMFLGLCLGCRLAWKRVNEA